MDQAPSTASVRPLTHRPLGRTGLRVPPIIFGTSCLGNLYTALPDETKRAILLEAAPAGRAVAARVGASSGRDRLLLREICQFPRTDEC